MGCPIKISGVKSCSFISLVVFLLSFGVVQAATGVDEEIAERIKPVGAVCVEGDEDCGGAVAAVSAGPAEPRSGEEVYNTACFACHGAGVAGAPKIGDAGAWASRIANGMDALVSNAINGINAMPPRGTCASCSDEEIKATVEYMVDKSQ